ncbi:MAG: cyclic nucleotide-binding domain-containing protein [Nitrospiria bacterium]
MRCPGCQADFVEEPRYCSECGYNIKSEERIPSATSSSGFSAQQEDLTANSAAEGVLKPPSGFRRTLSTELLEKQTELRTLLGLNTLIENRTYKPGQVIIHKGEMKKDLFFLTEGLVEISNKEGDKEIILDEIESPYILGDIAFLSGAPRMVTVAAKTEVRTFVLKYEDLRDLFKGSLSWIHPLLTSFASGIKSLHHKNRTLERRLLEMEEQSRNRT